MNLTEVVNQLGSKVENRRLSSEEILGRRKWLNQTLVVPDKGKADVDFHRVSFEGDSASEYRLGLSIKIDRTTQQAEGFIDDIFAKAKELTLPKGSAKASVSVRWEPRSFEEETALGELYYITVKSEAELINPSRDKFDCVESHGIEARLYGKRLEMSAKGRYLPGLTEIAKHIKPEIAKILLTREDSERVLRKLPSKLRKSLIQMWESKQSAEKEFKGAISPDYEDKLEIIVGQSYLPIFEDVIAKSLTRDSQASISHVSEMIKTYKGRRNNHAILPDLQTIARMIQEIDLGVFYNHPLITLGEAKELVDRGIDYVENMYREETPGKIEDLFRLAEEHFGEEILEGLWSLERHDDPNFKAASEQEYTQFLVSKGYKPVHFENVYDYSEKVRDIILDNPGISFEERQELLRSKGLLEKPKTSFPIGSHNIKELHLLAFLRQSHARDPTISAQKMRERYQNEKPELFIEGGNMNLDASKLMGMMLPRCAKVYRLRIDEGKKSEDVYARNEFDVYRGISETNQHSNIGLSFIIGISNPLLLPLQTYAMNALGINFSPNKKEYGRSRTK